MTDLTTDERLSTMLVPVLANLQEASVTAHQNAEALRTNGKIAAASAFVVLEQRADEQVERLAEMMEGLAADTVRIVDERLLVATIERVIRNDRENVQTQEEVPSPLRVAQLALRELHTSEALR